MFIEILPWGGTSIIPFTLISLPKVLNSALPTTIWVFLSCAAVSSMMFSFSSECWVSVALLSSFSVELPQAITVATRSTTDIFKRVFFILVFFIQNPRSEFQFGFCLIVLIDYFQIIQFYFSCPVQTLDIFHVANFTFFETSLCLFKY